MGGESKKTGKSRKASQARSTKPKWVKKKNTASPEAGNLKNKNIKSGGLSDMPKDIKPMLATLVEKPVDQPGWIYEIKWDGFRAISYLENGKAEIRSRNNKSFNDKFYPLHEALKKWRIDAVVDGEIIVANERGLPDFAALQTWRSEADGELLYYVFDLLWLNGENLMNLPLKERREQLKKIIPSRGMIRMSHSFDANPADFFLLTGKMGLEGIIAKHPESRYIPDHRSKEWLKIKSKKQQEAVIAGYTINENTSKKFSALLLGVYENGELVFTGPVGTGFTVKMQNDLLARMKPLITDECPFREVPEYNKPSRFRPNPPKAEVIWVKPLIVCEINYLTVSPDGTYRHPSFKGIREDKAAAEVVREIPVLPSGLSHEQNPLTRKKIIRGTGKNERKTLLNPTDVMQVRIIGSHEVKFTNLNKLFWPEEGVSKRDMLNYYYQAAPYLLPYYQDRPQTLNRFPHGIQGPGFYQKDVTGKVPGWIRTYGYYSETDEREKNFLVCSDEASLLYIANLGCIELNPWSSRTAHPDHPDWCIIDLDPDKNTFDQVIEAARITKEVLDTMGVPSFCKTSGSTGLHIYIPLGAKYTYEESKEFGRAIVKVVHAQLPDYTSIERLTANRKGKMYLDFLQNRPQATVAGPYSLRPRAGAPVSMPLHWDEVKKGLKILDFTIFNSIARLKEQGDIFKGVLGEGIDMKDALSRLR